ncbi:hypothetical protein [Butyrivibrio sp. AE2015]|uniref:hypothetical protein n=1 Tax=Butyrivibrio sp. AE2015 TaxID=1280663 RepID=UPI0003B33CD7|nr:hypothetical protein [Butyrivibrio sp. AE2015]
MLSVTQRLESVSQPFGGYVPKKLFVEKQYDDGIYVPEIGAEFAPTQGMVVDYLTRYMITDDKLASFDISIRGAKKVDYSLGGDNEYKNALKLLKGINGLDYDSIYNACKIVGYDSALRRGVETFKSVDFIKPTDLLISNIRIMVERCIFFLNDIGPIVESEVTFPYGYTKLVSSGDGDYMTKDTLIELKVSKSALLPKWSLQLLMYYLLGIHSTNEHFMDIESLCIYNPFENKSYVVRVDRITDETKYIVSHEILGYKMKYEALKYDNINHDTYYDYSSWRDVDGSDELIYNQLILENERNGFDVNEYPNGIHKISIEDYWSYLKTVDDRYKRVLRPRFKNIEYINFVKNSGYIMFLSVSPTGQLSILHGAKKETTNYSVEYFYENMGNYANRVVSLFSSYWDTLYAISESLRKLAPSTEPLKRNHYSKYIDTQKSLGIKPLSFKKWYNERGKNICLSGKVHGCIVDIDYLNHIYINPFDGTIVPYFAVSMYDKDVYRNTLSLISAQRPEMLESLKEIAMKEDTAVMASDAQVYQLVSINDEISTETVKVYDFSMYSVSNKLKALQQIYDKNLIQVWYDDILKDKKALLDIKTSNVIDVDYFSNGLKIDSDAASELMGKAILQNTGEMATLVDYRDENDIDVMFESGMRVDHTSMRKWIRGKVDSDSASMSLDRETIQEKRERHRIKYVGMSKEMKCGMIATIVKYENCNNITVRFENGQERCGVTLKRFKAGTIVPFHV